MGSPPTTTVPSMETPARGYAFQEELLYRAEAGDLRVVELPITFTERRAGQSKLRWRDVTEFFATILRLRRSGVLPHPGGVMTWGRLSWQERRFALGIGAILIVLTGLPYLYGWLRTPAGHTFTGIHALAAGDMAVYASHLEQVREGRWCLLDLYTSEQPQRCTVNIFWLTAGTVARALHLPGPLAFHVLRLALIIPFTMFLAVFVAAFIRTPIGEWSATTARRAALLILAFSAGIGAYLVPTITASAPDTPLHGYWPFDLGVPEAITFLTLYQTPHFIASLWLLLAIILFTLRFQQRFGEETASAARGGMHPSGPLMPERTWFSPNGQHDASERVTQIGGPPPRAALEHGGGDLRQDPRAPRGYHYSVIAGLAAAVLIQFHPFYAPTVAAVLIAWTIVESIAARRIDVRACIHTLIVGALTLPSVAYHLWLATMDPIVRAVATQNLLPTPPWWIAVVSYGFLAPLAVVGLRMYLRARSASGRLLVVWLLTTALLIYLPFPWQRRLTEGLHVAIVLSATPPLLMTLTWIRRRLPATIASSVWTPLTAGIIFVPIFAFSPLVNILDDIALYTLQFPTTIPAHTFYYPLAAVDAMRWIHAHAAPTDPVLALGVSGNFIPMYSSRTSVVGHGVLTTNFWEKRRTAHAAASGTLDAPSVHAFFARERIRYVLVTDADRLQWSIDPARIPYLTLVYRNTGAEVYERIVP